VPVLSFVVLLVVDDVNLLGPHVVDTDRSSRAVGSAVARETDPLPLTVVLGVCFPNDFADRAAQQATSVGDEDLVVYLVVDTVFHRPDPDQEPLSFVHCVVGFGQIDLVRRRGTFCPCQLAYGLSICLPLFQINTKSRSDCSQGACEKLLIVLPIPVSS